MAGAFVERRGTAEDSGGRRGTAGDDGGRHNVVRPSWARTRTDCPVENTGAYRFLSFPRLGLYVPAVSELLEQLVNQLQSRPRHQIPFSGSRLMDC